MKNRIRVMKNQDFEVKDIMGVKHHICVFNDKKFKNSIVVRMHYKENYNNVEVFKFALWCRKNDIRLVMYGCLNQLPIFGLFADAAILQDKDDWSRFIYDSKATHYNCEDGIFGGFEVFNGANADVAFNACLETTRPGDLSPDQWPLLMSLSERFVSDEEVVNHFSFPTIYVRESAMEKYQSMRDGGVIPRDLIMCEVKLSADCGGEHLLSIFREKTKSYPLPICYDLDFRRRLCEASGQDYMSIQVLSSIASNWMWIAYGGSSNILPFFPIKILSLSDVWCRYELTRKLFLNRYGPLGEVFPEFETLIYCLPEEKDGPSRTDGHRPLPNLKDLTLDLSRMSNEFVIER
jgi:hypothetical protein